MHRQLRPEMQPIIKEVGTEKSFHIFPDFFMYMSIPKLWLKCQVIVWLAYLNFYLVLCNFLSVLASVYGSEGSWHKGLRVLLITHNTALVDSRETKAIPYEGAVIQNKDLDSLWADDSGQVPEISLENQPCESEIQAIHLQSCIAEQGGYMRGNACLGDSMFVRPSQNARTQTWMVEPTAHEG